MTFYRTANLRCLRVHINRSTTSDEQHIFVFPHSNWMLCPLHALACMEGGMVRKKFYMKYMNNLLKEMSVQAEDAEGVVREVIGGLAFSVTKGLTS